MAKYNLFIDGVEVPEAGRAKKDSVIKIGEATGRSFSVRTDKGSEVYAATAEVEIDEPEAEEVFSEFLDFPGNYSGVTAPGAVEIAEAAGVPTKTETFPGKLTRRVHFGGDNANLTSETVSLIQESVSEALEDLHVWQKKNIDRRRGLTDMQRYNEHRDFIAKQLHKTTLAVKKGRI